MYSGFGARGWGHEQLGLTDDDGVFDLAIHAVDITLPLGLSARGTTAAFFGSGAISDGGGDLAYVQHLQLLEWKVGERALLKEATNALYSGLAADLDAAAMMGIEVVDDEAAAEVNGLATAMRVPPPRSGRWTAAVVALYVPNALNAIDINWGMVKDPVRCQYSVDELIANALLLFQNLRRASG